MAKQQAKVVPCPNHSNEGWCPLCGLAGVWFICPTHSGRLAKSGFCSSCRSYYSTE